MLSMRSVPAVAGLVLLLTSVASTGPVVSVHADRTAAAVRCGPVAVSHRGIGAGGPESTLRGFRGVIRVGMRTLESDVRFTRDQVPVIMHDATVDRTTDGHGRVAGLTYRRIARLDAGGGAKVPRLRGLVALAARRHVRLLTELKARRATVRQVRTVLRLVRARAMVPHTTVHSRHAANLRRVHRMAPRIRTMLVLRRNVNPPIARALDVIGVSQNLVTPGRVRRWHREGVRVYSFTVNRRAGWRRLDAAGVDGLVTDRPRAYLTWSRQRCG